MAKNILIVDDSATARQQLSFTLVREGFAVLEADNGESGISALETHRGEISLVISDVNMPRMGGLEMLSVIQSQNIAPGVPILLLTTETSKELVDRARQAGAKGWLVKPFQPEQLLGAVRKVLGA